MAVRFFLQNSNEYYSGFDEDYEAMQWIGSDAAIYTGFDAPHGSCMSFTAGAATPVYQLFDVESDAKYVFEAEYRSANTVTFEISDVSNGGIIVSSIDCAASTPHWSNFYHEETLASNCTQARLYVYGAITQTIYLDNMRWQGNAITFDPKIGNTPYSYEDSSERHIMQDGSLRITKSPRRLNARLHFQHLTHDQFTRLQNFVNANTETWFDDQAVPNSIDVGYVYNEVVDTYAATLYNKGYEAASQTLTASATIFETTEWGGLAYAALAVDDANYAGSVVADVGDYGFHKFSIAIPSSEIASVADIQTLDVIYKGTTDNVGAEPDGVKLFLWDSNKYVEIDSAYSSEKSTLNFSTTKPSLAQRFVYASGATLYVKAVVQSASANLLTNDIQLNSYYFQMTINENLSDTITLKNKAILDSGGDVVEVKNITRDDVLTLGTDYRIGENRQSVVLTSSPTAGDRIQVEYAKYWYVYPIGDFSENRFDPASATAPGRSVDLILEGVTTI